MQLGRQRQAGFLLGPHDERVVLARDLDQEQQLVARQVQDDPALVLVEEALEQMKPALGGVAVDPTIFRPATFIEMSLQNLSRALLIGCVLVVMVLMALTASPSFAAAEFCWRDAEGRGVGTIPQSCEAGRDRIGLLFSSQCPANMQRFGFDCHSVCPPGMRDDGLFCRLAEYGRGAGYPWQFGDWLNLDGARARCNQDNPAGCEQYGAIIYPTCKPG